MSRDPPPSVGSPPPPGGEAGPDRRCQSIGGLTKRLDPRTRREARIYLALCWILCVLSLSVVWLNKYPAQTDFPYHLVRFHMALNHGNPALGFARTTTLSYFPTPYVSADYLALLFGHFFSILIAGKLILSTYVALMVWAIAYLTTSLDDVPNPFGLAGFLFVFNWFFNMGFVNFAFGIPFFFLFLTYWWINKDDLTPVKLAVLGTLATCVYLSHICSYGLLLLVFLVLTAYCGRKHPRVFLGVVALLPSLVLLSLALARDVPSTHVGVLTAFITSSVSDKLSIAFGRALPYWASYDPWWERRIVGSAGFLILTLLLLQALTSQSDRRRNAMMLAVGVLILAYLMLPNHLVSPDTVFVASRALIFLPFTVLLALRPPRRAAFRFAIASIAFALAAAHVGLMFVAYRAINREYEDLQAAVARVPDHVRLAFWSDKRLAKIGNIEPIAHFDGYYYVERAGSQIPVRALPDFLAPLRTVQLRDQPMEDTLVEDVLRRGCRMAGQAGILILYAGGGIPLGVSRPEEQGCSHTASCWRFSVYRALGPGVRQQRRQEWSASLDDQTEYWKKGFRQAHDYLLLYADREAAETLRERGYELVFSKSRAHLLKRPSNAHSGLIPSRIDAEEEYALDALGRLPGQVSTPSGHTISLSRASTLRAPEITEDFPRQPWILKKERG